MTDPFPRKRLFRKEGRKEDPFGGGLDFNLHILFSRRGSERKSRVRCAPPGKQRPPVCFVFRPRSPPRRILPFVSSSGDIFQIQPTVPRKYGISQIFLDAPSIPPSRVSIVQAVIHELLDLDRSTIYCPLNLALDPRTLGEFRSSSCWKNGISIKKKENLLGEGIPRWMEHGHVTRANPDLLSDRKMLAHLSFNHRRHEDPSSPPPHERYCPVCLIFLRI